MLKKITAIGIWVNRFQFVEYLGTDGKLKTFGSYQDAWNFICENNLPLEASAFEMYQPW